MQIEWVIRSNLDSQILTHMQNAADLSLAAENVTIPCGISVCLCDDTTIKGINRDYRGIDCATDVLSFPSVSYPEGMTAGKCEKLLKQEYDADTGACFLGDLFISTEHIYAQAKEFGHSILREAVYLFVHGICHLLGYDHMNQSDQEKMRNMEEKIMFGINVSRNDVLDDDDALLKAAKEAMKRSYSPYSSYPVGAAIRCTDGRIFQGCNIENASFGLTNCAERTAIFKAVSEGARSFDVIAIAAKTKAWPCGACRQVLNEFAPGIRIMVTWDNQVEEKSLSELLPEGFGPDSM